MNSPLSKKSEHDLRDVGALILFFSAHMLLQVAFGTTSGGGLIALMILAFGANLAALIVVSIPNKQIFKSCYLPQISVSTVIAGILAAWPNANSQVETFALVGAITTGLAGCTYALRNRSALRVAHFGACFAPILMLNWHYSGIH